MHLDDTIVAIATPAGRGGIGVVRLSGSDAVSVARPMLRLAHGRELEAGRAHFGELIDAATGERIDEVVATFFAKPHSYTTEDVVEISCHGSPVVLRHVVEMAIAAGARLAEPGEFTMRAFLNGRIDLTQAEAVRDLIDSQTLYQAQVAARQLEGSLSKRLQRRSSRQLVELIATMEAGVDFAEDDVGVIPDEQILARIAAVRAPLEELLASFAFGKVVHEGLTLAIVGPPNVGKSSLFNRLVERERAIVTATPGTTRDLVSETVAIGGIPVRLIDTAGIRETADEAESIGVRKSMEALADADVVMVVLDVTSTRSVIVPFFALPTGEAQRDAELVARSKTRARFLVLNKIDLAPADTCSQVAAPALPPEIVSDCVATSAATGEGIPRITGEDSRMVGGDSGGQQERGFLTNVRQKQLVADSLAGLDKAAAAVPQKIPHEMLLLDLYGALRPLDDITGATTADDILNLIFSSFCIGK